MEKAERVVMLESDFDWDDVGEWPAITRHYDADGQGNVFKGGVAMDAQGMVRRQDIVTLLGLRI